MESLFTPDQRCRGHSLQDHIFGDELKKPLYDSKAEDETVLEEADFKKSPFNDAEFDEADFKKSAFNNASTKASLSPVKVIEIKRPVLSAAITLTVTCMGSGWLTLPKAFGIYGLVSGMILMTLAGVNG
jgi:hypothetical protein